MPTKDSTVPPTADPVATPAPTTTKQPVVAKPSPVDGPHEKFVTA